MAKTPCSQRKEPGFDPRSRELDLTCCNKDQRSCLLQLKPGEAKWMNIKKKKRQRQISEYFLKRPLKAMGKLVTLINLGSFQNTNSRPYPALWNSIIITMKWGLDICISTKILRWFWCTAWIESHWSEAPHPRPNGSNNSDGHSSWWTPDLWYSLWNSPNGHPFYTHRTLPRVTGRPRELIPFHKWGRWETERGNVCWGHTVSQQQQWA